MPANLTAQYKAAEERYRQASGHEEKLDGLREMLALLPKHKGTEKLQADLKKRISKLEEEGEHVAKSGHRGPDPGHVKKEGAGQWVILGPPNAGKSSLLAALTNAHPEIADYPFTTRVPQPGMMPFEDALVQLVDTPAAAPEHAESFLPNLARNADGLLLVLDVTADDVVAAWACCSGDPQAPPDRDGDGVLAVNDCDDSNPAVHTTVTAYPDSDGDGVGSGYGSTFCTDGSPPPGHVRSTGDCAPVDATAWRSIDFVDRDGDGTTVRDPAPLCAGATIPEPYSEVAQGNDCDDADPALFRWLILYRDEDGDGVGTRPRSIPCLGETIPAGWSRLGYDVDDRDPSVASDPAADELARLLD